MRKRILIPAAALFASLFLSETAEAQPFRPIPRPGPGPIFRPAPPPAAISIRATPRFGIGISIGAPAPVYRPPVVVVDPSYDYYRVVYRDRLSDAWVTYQVYESHRNAHSVADQLRDQGFQARVLHE